MVRLYGARRYLLFCALVTSLGLALAGRIALGTPYNAHPDEFIHVDAFCYFEGQFWLPPLNANGLEYGPEGESRIYDSEAVYFVYGRAAAALFWVRDSLQPASVPKAATHALPRQQYLPVLIQTLPMFGAQQALCRPHYPTYRLLNVGLFLVTLVFLFGVGARHAWAAAIGAALVCLPQIIYLYGYANSDAWALSSALLLIVWALARRKPLASAADGALLGVLTGLVLLSKMSVWVAIPLSYLVIGYRLAQDGPSASGARWPWRPAALALATVVLVITPMRIAYPLSQGGNLPAQLAQIREARAAPGFKPSDPYAPGRQLRSKGVGLDQVVLNLYWVRLTAESFYGYFGYVQYPAPDPAYWLALALALGNGLLTLVVLRRRWTRLPGPLRLALVAAPVMAAASVAASLYNSWTHDFQPQGRYILVAVVPIALWLWGTLPWEGPRLRAVRLASAVVLLLLSAYVLRHVVFLYPAFQV